MDVGLFGRVEFRLRVLCRWRSILVVVLPLPLCALCLGPWRFSRVGSRLEFCARFCAGHARGALYATDGGAPPWQCQCATGSCQFTVCCLLFFCAYFLHLSTILVRVHTIMSMALVATLSGNVYRVRCFSFLFLLSISSS